MAMNEHTARTPHMIGAVIRRIRKQRRLNQTELGDIAALRQETISMIENGQSSTRIETVLRVLAVLDLEFIIIPRRKFGPDWVDEVF